jgi:hypothetical protein
MGVRVLGLASGVTTAESHRMGLNGFTMAASPLNGRSGVYPTIGGAALATVSAMVCSIAPFNAWIDGTNTSTQSGYPFCLDATVNITFDAGNASTVRTDRVIAIVRDNTYDGSGLTAGSVEYLKGNTTTGAATALPSNALLLYEVAVQAGVNAGNGGINFSTYSTRKFTWTTASGGVLPVDSQTERDAISNPWSGCTVFRTDLKAHETFDGSIWRTLGMPVVSSYANLSTISNPFTGQSAMVSGTLLGYVYSGSQWSRAPGYTVDAVALTTNPIITAAAFSSETDIPRMTLTGTVVDGMRYTFRGQFISSQSTTDTEAKITIRHTTAVTGTIVGTYRIGRPAQAGFGVNTTWCIPWSCSGTVTNQNFYFSIVRTVGSGNTTLEGGNGSFSEMVVSGAGTLRSA